MALGSIYRHYIILSCFLLLLMYAVDACLVVFTCRCAGLIRFICTSYGFYWFYSAVSPAVQLLPPKLIFEPGIYRNALLPFCYTPSHPLPVDTAMAICNIHHISCRGYLQESAEETCLLVSRNPYTLPVCLVCRICRNICNLCIHFCSLCLVLLSLSS